jgi:hypothetical protein
MRVMLPLTRIEITVGLISITLGLAGYLLESPPITLVGLVGTVFAFGTFVAKALS